MRHRNGSHSLSYSDRVPWSPINRRMAPHRNGMLFSYRDADGVDWWSDGAALFQGEAPGYLRRAYRAAYQVSGEDDTVPVAVFAADMGVPELHVDARYLAYAEARFNTASCWRVGHAIVTVRSPRALVGIIEGRDLPPPRRRQR